MNDDNALNGLNGHNLERALDHDAAQRSGPSRAGAANASDAIVAVTAAVKEAYSAPCPVCNVKEGEWCSGAPLSLVGDEMIAKWTHVNRVKLARAEVSRRQEAQLKELHLSLPHGPMLKSDRSAWPRAMQYANGVLEMKVSEAMSELAQQLGVEPAWLAGLPAAIARAQAPAPVGPPPGVPPIPRPAEAPKSEQTVDVEQPRVTLERLVSRVGIIEREAERRAALQEMKIVDLEQRIRDIEQRHEQRIRDLERSLPKAEVKVGGGGVP